MIITELSKDIKHGVEFDGGILERTFPSLDTNLEYEDGTMSESHPNSEENTPLTSIPGSPGSATYPSSPRSVVTPPLLSSGGDKEREDEALRNSELEDEEQIFRTLNPPAASSQVPLTVIHEASPLVSNQSLPASGTNSKGTPPARSNGTTPVTTPTPSPVPNRSRLAEYQLNTPQNQQQQPQQQIFTSSRRKSRENTRGSHTDTDDNNSENDFENSTEFGRETPPDRPRTKPNAGALIGTRSLTDIGAQLSSGGTAMVSSSPSTRSPMKMRGTIPITSGPSTPIFRSNSGRPVRTKGSELVMSGSSSVVAGIERYATYKFSESLTNGRAGCVYEGQWVMGEVC